MIIILAVSVLLFLSVMLIIAIRADMSYDMYDKKKKFLEMLPIMIEN